MREKLDRKELDTQFVGGASTYRIEQAEYEFCPLECKDCGTYPMQAVYAWKMREIVCTKCRYDLEEDYFEPETVTQWDVEEEAERREEEDFYHSLGLISTKNLQFPQCPINPQCSINP